MMNSLRKTNPFVVIRATVEAEIAAPGILAISSAVAGDGKMAVAAGNRAICWPGPGTVDGPWTPDCALMPRLPRPMSR